jgi:hypothetical protein
MTASMVVHVTTNRVTPPGSDVPTLLGGRLAAAKGAAAAAEERADLADTAAEPARAEAGTPYKSNVVYP